LIQLRPERSAMTRPNRFDESIRVAMVELVRGPATDSSVLERTLESVTSSAVELIDGVDFADVLVMHEGRARSAAPTAPGAVELDSVQLRHREGPCLEAAVSGGMIRCTDLREDRRWPTFAEAAINAGVLSILSYQLVTHHNGVGALNFFGRAPREADPAGETMGAVLATMATVALMTAAREEQFRAALASRDVIGQAKGILMNHFKVDADHAFTLLKQLSQSENTPLRMIAQRVVESF
jgi:transcriptional regulator with GAF, ATPase, and Fis domain